VSNFFAAIALLLVSPGIDIVRVWWGLVRLKWVHTQNETEGIEISPSGRGRGVWREGGHTRFTSRMSFVPASRKNSILFVWCSSDAIACLVHLGGSRASLSCVLHSVQYIRTTPLVTTTAVPSSGTAHCENDRVDSAILKIITQCRSQ
jgi:hypothetical protein